MRRKWIRTLALALIALPEPFTTVPGLLLLAVSFFLWRQTSLKKFRNLEDLVKRSLQNSKPAGFHHYVTARQAVISHVLKMEPVLQPEKSPLKPEPAFEALQNASWFDNRKLSASVLHHTLKTSFPQYEAAPEVLGNAVRQPIALKDAGPAVQHHTLKLSLIPNANSNLN